MADVIFAPEMDTAEFSPIFLEKFFRVIFDLDFGDILFVSMDSTCLDFDTTATAEELYNSIEREYGVDCRHVEDLNLYRVLKRVWDAGTATHH